MKTFLKHIIGWSAAVLLPLSMQAQESPKEEDFYKIATIPVPEGIVMEVGGVTTLPNGDIAVSTRRGDVWVIKNPYMSNGAYPSFTKFASGLHEILGLVYKDGSLYCAQRGELTKLTDKNGDGKADSYETVYAWPLSGHYHEYSFGPKIAPDGSFFVTGNVAFGDEEWWRGESRVPWRGWTMRITPDGKMEPWATGMRSPCGIGIIDGEFFYDDNQGDWMGSGGIWHVAKGDFTGHPAGLRWAKQTQVNELTDKPVKVTTEQLYAKVDPRFVRQNGRAVKPENNREGKEAPLFTYKKDFPQLKTPAVWLPHGVLGISNSEIITDETVGKFGPFAGQVFVGDQGQSKIMRVFLEKVNGEYQGAAFDFRSGFQSGVLRMSWGKDGSLFVGETNRGWGSAGDANQGLQRLIWNGKMPFEMKAVRAMPDGFEVEFTMPVDKASAEDIASYQVKSFTYKYYPVYGSPTINEERCTVKGVKVSEDGMKVRVVVDNLREYYVHELLLEGVRTRENSWSLVHPTAYYTLNAIPAGEKLNMAEVSKKNSAAAATTPATSKTPAKSTKTGTQPATKKEVKPATAAVPTTEEIMPLLRKHTCLACHSAEKKVVGPSYADVAKRKYSNEKIVDLIYNPKPENWPGYATPMAPMPQVPKADALKIAAWINSLGKTNSDKPNP
ncbi:DUF7133 domain-containing protein [Xanthocytophaga agilis]|uniref:Cytochrome c domain-containing protein n=1 Tax=Xanthocytophaga agilis TaxID=3048010 RepID=A0AAE3RCW7_9BACT|nr:c-type cytochrome [Xanthocytophaga agilis]MDJ1506185.1 hypothetical protein [Xanthocytophaga agilis]